jgi:Tol biopolymer transport system component
VEGFVNMKRVLTYVVLALVLLSGCLLFTDNWADAAKRDRISFASNRGGNFDTYVRDINGEHALNLTNHATNEFGPWAGIGLPVHTWSPDGRFLAYVSGRDGVFKIYVMDTWTRKHQRLTHRREKELAPAWSPDGKWIAFASHDNERDTEIYKIDVKSGHLVQLTDFGGNEHPAWSPDGKQFAYSSIDWGRLEFACHIATLGEQESEFLVDGSFPAWSPDGTEIACTVAERLTLINVRTGTQKQLLPKNVESFQRDPSWSAAGDKLAFAWNKHPVPPPDADIHVHDVWQDKTTIYIINRDGTDLQQLVEEAGPYAQSPALSPDGKEVLYTREIKGHFQIFKLDLNSGIRSQLTHILGWNTGGDWFDPAYALPVSPQPQLLTTLWGKLKQE